MFATECSNSLVALWPMLLIEIKKQLALE